MAVKIRLTRLGDKKSPFYRVVVTDSRKARDGAYIENIGTYNPLVNPAEVKINEERAKYWIAQGEILTNNLLVVAVLMILAEDTLWRENVASTIDDCFLIVGKECEIGKG